MATLAELRKNTYDLLYGPARIERPEVDLLNGAIGAGDGTLQFDTTTMWYKDDLAEFRDNGEIVRLLEDHQAGATSVLRGEPDGQTTAAAQSDNAVVYRNPAHPQYLVNRMINEVVDNELGDGIWIRNNRTLSGGYITGKSTYELAADDFDVEQMFQYDVAGTFEERPIPWFDLNLAVPAAVSSTGKLLRIHRVHDPDEDVYYTVKTRPSSSDLASLPATVAAMVPWGAVGKLLTATIGAKRGAPNRSPQAVTQAGDRPLRDATFFRSEFERMKEAERRRLQKELMKEKTFRPRRRRSG